jgi:Concanavalin A-like lectin/glucanases superfamily/Chitobiase/beta-hexosaminidase C-terminal domain/Right handed beta helix region
VRDWHNPGSATQHAVAVVEFSAQQQEIAAADEYERPCMGASSAARAAIVACLCAASLTSSGTAASTLVLGYALNEGSGGVAVDASGFNRTGTLVNGPVWTSTGRFGGALLLDGASEYVRTDGPNLPTGDFTWALWLNLRSHQPFATVMEAQGPSSAELELDLLNGALTVWSSGVQRLTTAAIVPTNVWTHVALTRAGDVMTVYINGAADQRRGSDSRTFDFASCPLLLGVDADSGCAASLNGYLHGEIDEVQIHNRALSADEIRLLMAVPLGSGGVDTAPLRSTTQSEVQLPAGSREAVIFLTTDEPATCKYDVRAGVAYPEMTVMFASTGTTAHSHTVSGLTDGSTTNYYIKCQDQSGNANTDDFLIKVTVGSSGTPAPNTTTYYVSPAGNDLNPGTLAQPFRTIERARQAVRGINSSMSSPIRVYLRGGEYFLTAPVTFDRLDSGTNGYDVIYAGYPGEQPVLHGGQRVSGWTPVGGGVYKAFVGQLRFRQLYVNGRRAIRARTPNAGTYNQVVFWDTANRRVQVGSGEIANWQRRNQVELVILGAGVNQSNLRIASASASVVTPMEPERTRIFQQTYPPKGAGRPYYFENALEFLDAPGEWYLNTDSGELFYMPRSGEDVTTAGAVVPRLEQLVTIAGSLSSPVRNIQFHNLTFAYSTWLRPSDEGFVGDQASIVFTQPLPEDEITSYPGHRHPAAVHVTNAHNIVFERNTFTHLGSSGLNLYSGTQDNRVVGNVFTDISASGVSVGLDLEGNPADPRQVSRRAVIRNNYLSRTGVDFYQTVGIMVAYAEAAVIEHNELSDMPYSGISVGWGWADADNAARDNFVRSNRIQNVLRLMSDGGGIYTLSRQPGTLVAENYVHDIVRTGVQGGFNISGIYLDEGSSFITVRDNVLVRTGDRGVFQNANGGGNVLSNNGGQTQSTMDNAGLEPAYSDIRPGASPAPDTAPPLRFDAQPDAPLPAGTASAQLSLSTDEPATCKMATTPNVAFATMPTTFAMTGGNSHATVITGLSDGSSYAFYVRCRDNAGNANPDDLTITVTVASAPSATVSTPVISPNGGQFAGPVTVTLTTATEGASVRYTTDGSVPTQTSPLYTAPLTISNTLTLRAAGFKTGLIASAVASATFTVTSTAPTGLVARFQFSEGGGSQTVDSSSNQNVGVLTNGVGWTTGRYGSGLAFDGIDDYVRVESPDLPTGDFTWAAWIRASQWKSFQGVLMGGDDIGPELAVEGTGRILVVHDGGRQRMVGASAIPTGTWSHITLTRAGSLLRIYINGVQDAVGATSGTPYGFGTCSLLIGIDSDTGCTGALNGSFAGTIDEVRVYNRALSESEIRSDMSQP